MALASRPARWVLQRSLQDAPVLELGVGAFAGAAQAGVGDMPPARRCRHLEPGADLGELRGSAGPRQVPKANAALQHSLGLGGACVVYESQIRCCATMNSCELL